MKKLLALLILLATPGTAASAPFTHADTVLTVPVVARPAYLTPIIDPTFGSKITRISADSSTSATPISGVWGAYTRHHYSKNQPWNSDQSKYLMYRNNGPWALLNGTTYAMDSSACSSWYDPRWHPDSVDIIIDANATKITKYRISNAVCDTVRTWTLPFANDYGIGNGEGNLSANGRYIAIGSSSLRKMVVVDLDTTVAGNPYGGARFGPTYTFPACSLVVGSPLVACNFDNVSISPSGKYVAVMWDSSYTGYSPDNISALRIYDVNPTTLALTPHTMAAGSERCNQSGAYHGQNGWIIPLSHADMGYDTAGVEVIVGNSHCDTDNTIGSIYKVALSTGATTGLTDYSGGDAYPTHLSMRAADRPGWVYSGFEKQVGRPFSDEVVAIALDGSGVERIAHMHDVWTSCYGCEPQPVPSRDGRRVTFASTWTADCGTGCGTSTIIKDYVASNFSEPDSFALAVNALHGSVEQTPDSTNGKYPVGTAVKLTAAHDTGYSFVNWTGHATGTTDTVTVLMSGNRIVNANFVADAETLTVTAVHGMVTRKLAGVIKATSFIYSYGQAVLLTAVDSVGYAFSSWSGDTANATALDTLTVVMLANKAITATFDAIGYIVTVTLVGPGTVTKDPNASAYVRGDSVELTASPNSGGVFISWKGDTIALSNPLTVPTYKDRALIARFVADECYYTLKYIAGDSISLVGADSQYVTCEGNGSTVTAVPATGYHFVTWSDGVLIASRAEVEVGGDITVTASAAINTYTLAYAAGAHGTLTGTTTQTVAWGASGTTVTAVANEGCYFVRWNDGITTAARTDSTVTANVSVTAMFAPNTILPTPAQAVRAKRGRISDCVGS
jgi:NOL1/NOP2/fmu family ribosome biogenesis protein